MDLTENHNVATQYKEEEEERGGEVKWKLELTAWPLLHHKNIMPTASIETESQHSECAIFLPQRQKPCATEPC